MNRRRELAVVWLLAAMTGMSELYAGALVQTVELWPTGSAPRETGQVGEEHDTTKADGRTVAGKRVARITNVSKPTITIYRPSPRKNTGTAVMVCPGGAYKILATDLEGTEVCAWLNSIGVTGLLLKYRVPLHEDDKTHLLPLQDAQRGLGLIRRHAKDWGIDPKRIGALGFSAGGHLVANLSNNYERRAYPGVDDADATSCRPDFSLMIYPGLLLESKNSDRLAPEMKITSNTPPTFMAMAADDPVRVENPLYYALALQKSKVPVELHVYPAGGHGYGLRPQKDLPVTSWPARANDWMRSQGWLNR